MKGDPNDSRGPRKRTSVESSEGLSSATGEQFRKAMSALTEIAVQWEKGDNADSSSSTAKVLLTTTEAAAVLGIGRTSLYELIRSGKLETIKIGRRRLIPATAIPKLITTLIEESEDP